MNKKIFIFYLFLFYFFNCYVSQAQNAVYYENCETTGFNWRATFSNQNAVYVSGVSNPNDKPSNTPKYNSFNRSIGLFGVGNAGSGPERTVLTLPTVSLNPNSAYCLKLKLASFGIDTSTNVAAGLDNQDYFRISVSYNGSNTFSPEIQVNGANSNIWSFTSPFTIYRTVQGAYSNYSQVTGQEYSTVFLEIPINTSQLSVEIEMSCNSAGESWLVDDIELIPNCYSPLPIELLYFTGDLKDDKIELNWATATETNNDFFTIYSSNDIENINVVDQVDGNGNSNSLTYYTYTDNNPKKYYRLCQTDYDGKYECFDWISINNYEQDFKQNYKIYDVYGRENYIIHNNFMIIVDENGKAYKFIMIK